VRHPIDCQQLIELGDRSQRRYAQVEMRARRKLDVLPRVFLPVRDGDGDRNPKIARHIEHPQAASHCSEPSTQIPNVTIA
jgi:hypothetical protein